MGSCCSKSAKEPVAEQPIPDHPEDQPHGQNEIAPEQNARALKADKTGLNQFGIKAGEKKYDPLFYETITGNIEYQKTK